MLAAVVVTPTLLVLILAVALLLVLAQRGRIDTTLLVTLILAGVILWLILAVAGT